MAIDQTPTPTHEPDLSAIHQEALISFDQMYEVCWDERRQSIEDRRFGTVAGAMWEDQFGEQFTNRPKLEINKVHLAVIGLINEYRANRVSVDFLPMPGVSDDNLADTCDGLYRAAETTGVGMEAYDNAFEEAVSGGFGAYRLRAVYEDEYDATNDHQKIIIEPIYDADSSVFFDLDAKRQDKSDATKCWVLTAMTHERYRLEYNSDPATWHADLNDWTFDWATPDLVYVAEYYRVETSRHKVQTFRMLNGDIERYWDEDFEENPELEGYLADTGAVLISKRQVKRRRVRKYILSGAEVLEDCGYIAGAHIPIIPQYGKRWMLQSIERFMGHVRLAKDMARLKNMQTSRLAEISGLSGASKPIMTPEQVSGHENQWAEDNVKNYPYLCINPVEDANGNEQSIGPVGYTKAPEIPPALAALLQSSEVDLQDLLGNLQQGEQIQPRISGKAVELIHNRLDMQVYIYLSNTAKARRRGGEVWLSMAKDVYVESGRVVKTKSPDGSDGTVELSRPVQTDSGGVMYENDISTANMEVSVDVGPSFSSRRAAVVTALINMMGVSNDPETIQVLGAMAMMNMEGEGLSDVRDYYRMKLVRMGVLKPTDKEAETLMKEMENAPPDPNAEYLKAAAESETAKAQKSQAEIVKILADAERIKVASESTRADILATLSELSDKELQRALQSVQRLPGDQPTNQMAENPLTQD